MLLGPDGSTGGGVSGGSLRQALLGCHASGANLSSIAPASWRHPGEGEPSSDHATGNAKVTRQGVFTFSGQVSAQEVIRSLHAVATRTPVDSVTRGNFIGHVYNLSTEPHWYAAQSIVTHNCDCRVAVEGEDVGSYDPDALYQQYLDARDAATSGGTKAVLSSLRETQGIN